ncbi:MAG: type II toxin-antitoxin system VapB family antitoxin [Myxococcales bacterium]|nr:type II toxin-antitoxin system VapB family antitoxin [Myxococcales bacterium]MCB9576534.1 type II toxin-antitoxin system VapB family antitoxin [Polyangiaceae bacterium]
MHRTTLVIDPRKLARARKLLGTKGIKDTIERALDEVIAYEQRRKAVEQLREMDGLELDDPEVTADAWR